MLTGDDLVRIGVEAVMEFLEATSREDLALMMVENGCYNHEMFAIVLDDKGARICEKCNNNLVWVDDGCVCESCFNYQMLK